MGDGEVMDQGRAIGEQTSYCSQPRDRGRRLLGNADGTPAEMGGYAVENKRQCGPKGDMVAASWSSDRGSLLLSCFRVADIRKIELTWE